MTEELKNEDIIETEIENQETSDNKDEQLEEDTIVNEIDDNLEKIKQLEKQVDEMKDLAQRTQAEFMNYKRRVTKEKQDLTTFANEKIVTELLAVLDNFQRALDSEKENTTGFYQGVDMIKKQLEDVLNKNGLEEIECLNEPFDPNYHHAVMQVEGDEPDKVMEILQKGYKLKEKVIRPAMVKVSK
ncbi:MAG: nucleotide exchange factor GrpE [Peptoanaerobacter stomatis]|uniref:nucleotide exchange factor GrpE n=1 Tax=Peptoanaerobacter stomatis TaxID=796937 RepID=UPI003F9FFB0B